MRLSARLKKWLIENMAVKATADDETFRKAAGEAIAAGDLDLGLVKSLTETKEDKEASEFQNTMKSLGEAAQQLKSLLEEDDEEDEDEEVDKKSIKGKKKKPAPVMEEDDEEDEDEEVDKKSIKGKTSTKSGASFLEKMVSRMGSFAEPDDEEKGFEVRVKGAAEQYSSTKTACVYPMQTKTGRAHPLAGKPVLNFSDAGRPMDSASELDKAVAGAFAKFLVNTARVKSRSISFQQMPEHDRDLLMFAMEKMKWGGASDGGDFADIKDRPLTPREQKALIDDATSGGLEAAPIVFDDQVIQTPLLNGELFPLVSTQPLDRGRRIEGVATGTVTGSWGGVDDTEITLFDTTAYVTAFDTTIFRWQGAIRIGLDFLSDTSIDFGAHITAQYGERLLEDLDDVIATGNGTTQPEGVSVKSGTTSVAFGGATSIGNYESLRFGVAKPEHRANLMASAVFCGTETSYQRARAIPVGASDARRLGGSQSTVGGVSEYGNYSWMGMPYKINESLGNTKIFYAILARYRMYRRRGLTIRTSTEGDTLIRRNEMLITAMARYGGQLERGAVAAVTSTAPA